VARNSARAAVFQKEFREDLRYWVKTDRNIAVRVLDLVEAIMRDPFEGVGKPEPLRYVLEGCWSRRITQEHRLVYRISDDRIDFLRARYHY
jgi:toxin YoeB